jgi:protein-tyrosine phosphatase
MSPTIYWVRGLERGRLAIVSRPDPAYGLSKQMLALREDGLDVLVSMLQVYEAVRLGLASEASVAEEAGLVFHHLPTDDFAVPRSFETAGAMIGAIAQEIEAGRAVGVHCFAGRGRSPLFAACVLAHLGMEPQAAIEAISEARGRRTPETEAQRQWIHDFAAWRRTIVE